MRVLYGICAAVLSAAALGGCAALIGGGYQGELGENLALASTGATASDPAFNDGNIYTHAETNTPQISADERRPRDIMFDSVAEVRFKEPTKVNQIAVVSRDLDKPLQAGMWVALEYLKDGEWKTARKWSTGNTPRNPKASMEAVADGVRVRIRRPPTYLTGGRGQTYSGDNGNRTVYEVQAFQYVSKEPSSAEEE